MITQKSPLKGVCQPTKVQDPQFWILGRNKPFKDHLRGVMLLTSVDISTRAPWITQNEQHFVAGEIPHELDTQLEGH
jgi:hypothetical protein